MAIKKVYELAVDLKRTSVRVNIPVLVQGDSAEFRIRLLDNGAELSTEQLTGITKVSMQSGYDAQTVIQTVGALQGSVAVFRLKKNELFRSGTVQAMVQLEDTEDRISTLRFQYQVIPDLAGNYIPGEQDITVFQRYMNEAQAKIDEMAATDVAQLTVKLAETGEKLSAFDTYEIYEPPLASNEWVAGGSNGRSLDMTAEQFLQLFYNPMVGSHANGYTVTKTSKGKDQSGSFDLWEYDFKPANYTKTILLSSGMHPFELSAHFGLAYFMRSVMANPYPHSGFKYLRENVRIKVIPVINPWGFTQNPKTYGNVNGVNINRNFDFNGRWATFPTTLPNVNEFNYKGTAPYSEAETRIMRDWVLANNNSSFWIDMHTGLDIGPWDNFIYYLSTSPIRSKIETALASLENRIKTKYGKANPTKEVRIDSDGSIRHWFSQETAGVPTMTLEQTPNNLLWGTSKNNEAGDITEFEVTIAAYVFALLDIESNSVKEYTASVDNKIVSISNDIQDIRESNKELSQIDTRLTEFELFMLKQLDTVVFDRFNRPDNTTLGNAETGQLWVDYPDNINTPTARMGIVNRKAVEWITDSSGNKTCLDAGIGDFIVSADITFSTYAGLIFRFVDVKNHMMARINSTGVAVTRNINGTIATLSSHLFTPIQGSTYNLKISARGGEIKVYLNDVQVISITDTAHVTATKIGFRTMTDKNSAFDNFIVRNVI